MTLDVNVDSGLTVASGDDSIGTSHICDYEFDTIIGEKDENWIIPLTCKDCNARTWHKKTDFDEPNSVYYGAVVMIKKEQADK